MLEDIRSLHDPETVQDDNSLTCGFPDVANLAVHMTCGQHALQVDEVLQQHEDVAEAAAFATPDSMLGEIAEAAVVLAPGSTLKPQEASMILREFAASRLDKHKVGCCTLKSPILDRAERIQKEKASMSICKSFRGVNLTQEQPYEMFKLL